MQSVPEMKWFRFIRFSPDGTNLNRTQFRLGILYRSSAIVSRKTFAFSLLDGLAGKILLVS